MIGDMSSRSTRCGGSAIGQTGAFEQQPATEACISPPIAESDNLSPTVLPSAELNS